MANVKRAQVATPAQIVEARGDRTQIQVAEQLQVSRSTIQNWESGKVAISKVQFDALRGSVSGGA